MTRTDYSTKTQTTRCTLQPKQIILSFSACEKFMAASQAKQENTAGRYFQLYCHITVDISGANMAKRTVHSCKLSSNTKSVRQY